MTLENMSNLKWFKISRSIEEMLLNEECPYNIGGGTTHLKDDRSLSYTFISGKMNKKFVEIKINGSAFFVDTSVCEKLKKNECEINIAEAQKKISSYEEDWIQLKEKYKEEKDNIDRVFKALLKAIENKDNKKILSYVLVDSDNYKYEEDDISWHFIEPIQEKVDDLVGELEECAKKKELVGYGSNQFFFKGNKKICSLRQGIFKIQWVDYPETFMVEYPGSARSL